MKTINEALSELKKLDEQEKQIYEFIKEQMAKRLIENDKQKNDSFNELKDFFDYLKNRDKAKFSLSNFGTLK